MLSFGLRQDVICRGRFDRYTPSEIDTLSVQVQVSPPRVLFAIAGRAPTLLIMGAFGHSRLRQLMLGSTTSTLLRVSDVPVLILR